MLGAHTSTVEADYRSGRGRIGRVKRKGGRLC